METIQYYPTTFWSTDKHADTKNIDYSIHFYSMFLDINIEHGEMEFNSYEDLDRS